MLWTQGIIFAWNVEPKCGQTNRNWPSKDFKWAIFCCWQCKSKWEMRTNTDTDVIYAERCLWNIYFTQFCNVLPCVRVFVVRELKADFFFCLTSSWLERIKIYSNFTIEYRFARQKSRRFRFFGRSTSVEIITKYFVTEIKQVQKNR